MSTVLQVIQQYCYRYNIAAPSTVVGVASTTELQLLSLFKKIGDLLRNYPCNWPQLKRTYNFNTQTDVSLIQLPGDFYRLLESTGWDVTNSWPLRGPISDYNMAIRQLAVVSLQTRKAFRILGPVNYLFSTSPYSQRSAGYFEIDPPGQNNTDELQIQYHSANWVWPRDWVASTSYTIGDLRTGVANIYRAKTTATSGTTRPSWTTSFDTDGGVQWYVDHEPYVIANDGDLCLFDDDLMIEGMRWAYLDAKLYGSGAEVRSDWEAMVRRAAGRFSAPTRINASDEFGDQFGIWPNIPPGDWNI